MVGTRPTVLRQETKHVNEDIRRTQDSDTTDESPPENVEGDLDLAELIGQHENTDWSEIPGISAAETGAWTARLIEARDAVEEGP